MEFSIESKHDGQCSLEDFRRRSLTGVISSSTWIDGEQEGKAGHEEEDHFHHDHDVRLSNEERTASSSGSLISLLVPSVISTFEQVNMYGAHMKEKLLSSWFFQLIIY